MAERKPLVLVGGELKELPAEDTLPSDALPAGGTATVWQGSATLAQGQSLTVVHDADADKKRLVQAFRQVTTSGAQLIPAMTSNTTPSGIASASQVLSVNYEAWHAMDGQVSTFWSSLNPDPPHWLRYDSPAPLLVTGYAVGRRMNGVNNPYGAAYFPSSFRLQYSSDNGMSWLDADVRSAVDFGAVGEAVSFELGVPVTSSKWRLYVTASGGANYSQVSRFELFGVGETFFEQVKAADYAVRLNDTSTVLTRTAAGSEDVTLNVLIA